MSAKDGKFIQLQELKEQMRGINPKLSLYATIKAQYDKLLEELEGEEMLQGESVVRRMVTQNGAQMKYNIRVKTSNLCVHQKGGACGIPGCPNVREGKKRCKQCGKMKYRSFCRQHAAEDLPVNSFVPVMAEEI